jgi:glycerate dehydrogenase
MMNTVFLNAARLDFDASLDFSPLTGITRLTKYDASSDDEILQRVREQQIVITKELPLGQDLIDRFPGSVRLICEAGTGYNNIDVAAAGAKGIAVCNVPGYSTGAVAQLAITFILALGSSLAGQQRMVERGSRDNFSRCLQLPHLEVQNKTLGVIGGGTIGREVMKIARSLGMNVLVSTRTPQAWDDPGISPASLDYLLQRSDFVTIHCPLTPETRYLIAAEQLSLMKPSAFIINTSRGPIIRETDLIDALCRGTVAGAALDVQDPEPPAPDNPLFAMDNVILTPHIGWKARETRQRLVSMVAGNIAAFVRGEPANLVR